jgi:hypothetical protein
VPDNPLRIVKLMEPALCMSCRFASIATVQMQDGSARRMLHCKRLDCDQWVTEEIEDQDRPESITEEKN